MIVIRHDQLAFTRQRGKRRRRFDGQLIKREMFGAERKRLRQFGLPLLRRLAGAGIDQIEADTFEIRARQRQRRLCFAHIVQAPEHFQIGIVQRLHAERQPVDTRRGIILKPRRIDTGRIGFERDLDAGRDGPQFRDRFQHAADRGAGHQRRRAAAEENGFDCGPRRSTFILPGGDPGQFAHNRIAPAIFVDRAADMAVEIAIGALCGAERPMDVNAEAAHRICISRFTPSVMAGPDPAIHRRAGHQDGWPPQGRP